MSYFGRNIKKIRLAKNISQTSFADIFHLTRSSIGAYEEGRAEAKIDTIIEISEYFSLSLDQLLKKELTINEIYRIREISSKLDLSSNIKKSEIEIPFISKYDYQEFIKKHKNSTYLQGLQKIKLPGLQKENLAFEFHEVMDNFDNSSLRFGDLLISGPVISDKQGKNARKKLFIILLENALVLARYKDEQTDEFELYYQQNQKYITETNSRIKAIWQIYQIIGCKNSTTDEIGLRLKNIESKLTKLLGQ
jgi:transcriptional regulator with XRE-family HTH domain